MIILQQSLGLANSIYEYFTAYALAKELGEELRLDITFALQRQATYTMDLLSFPKVKKIKSRLAHGA